MYACREVEHLAPRLVLVGQPDADPELVSDVLDAVAAAHRRIEGPGIAPVDVRGRVGAVPFLSLECDAVVDMEHLLTGLSSRGERTDYAIAMAINDALLDAVEAGHAAVNPATGAPYALGAMSWGSLLVGRRGDLWLFGFGSNFPVRSPQGLATVAGVREAPEVALGLAPTPTSDVYVVWALWRNMVPFAVLPERLIAALQGREAGPGQAGEVLAQMNRRAASLDPSERPATISELRASYHAIRQALGVAPDPAAARARLRGHVQRAAPDVTGSGGEAPRRDGAPAQAPSASSETGPYWHAGRYRKERALDAGATSTVFMGWDRQLEQRVAMKILRADCSETMRQRFHREVRILRSVRHPHLVRGYDLFEERGHLVAIMEYIPGVRFDSLTAEPPSTEALLTRGAEILDALAALHAMGVVHRDVKPANIIVHADRGAVLVDFGGAREARSDLTQSGAAVGTLGYMAPEQLAGAPAAGPAADVYALAVVLVEALTGRKPAVEPGAAPFAEQGRALLAAAELEPALSAALHAALSPKPEERPGAAALREVFLGRPGQAGSAAPIADPGAVLQVGPGAKTLRLPSGVTVDLRRRRAPRRILACLLERHAVNADETVSVEELQEAGWPGERMTHESGRGRVYVAMYTLRKMGLAEVIEREDDGYRIAPGFRVQQ